MSLDGVLPREPRPDRLPDAAPAPVPASSLVQFVHGLEHSEAIDRWSALLGRASAPLARAAGVRRVLLGQPAGHALHPVMTDLPLGMWTSAVVLDLLGGKDARPAARRLLGLGLAAALPTAATGLAEWRETSRPESRVGTVHAGLNTVGLALYAGSFLARRRGRHGAGVALALAGSAASGAAGYLGGHLTTVRKVGSRHPAYLTDGVGPRVSRPPQEEPFPQV